MRQMNLVYSMRRKRKVKKRRIITVLSLSITLYLSACSKQEPVSTVEPTETIETTTEQSEAEVETEKTTETNMEEVNNKMFGLDDIDNTSPSEDKTSSSESSETIRTDYPDSNTEHRKAWDNFCENWNESDYGTTTAGKCENDFPYYGDTGYDPKGTILQYRTTDKGYTVFYDTNTGRVYYTGMTLPTGDAWDENESAAVLTTYALSKGYNGFYDITYAEMQEVLGVYNGD